MAKKTLTTDQGVPVADNQSSLTAGTAWSGPTAGCPPVREFCAKQMVENLRKADTELGKRVEKGLKLNGAPCALLIILIWDQILLEYGLPLSNR